MVCLFTLRDRLVLFSVLDCSFYFNPCDTQVAKTNWHKQNNFVHMLPKGKKIKPHETRVRAFRGRDARTFSPRSSSAIDFVSAAVKKCDISTNLCFGSRSWATRGFFFLRRVLQVESREVSEISFEFDRCDCQMDAILSIEMDYLKMYFKYVLNTTSHYLVSKMYLNILENCF